MDIILIIAGVCCILAGFMGSFLPVLPGPPLSYAGLLLMQFTSHHPFSTAFLIFWAFIVIALMILDNVIPAWTTKRVGGSSFGVWGSVIGLIIGFFFSPLGILVGPLVGAFLGELVAGKSTNHAFRSAWGSFLGLLFGTLLNVIAAGMMGYYFLVHI